MWFELQRRKQHLFYMRMDFVDLMMFHPDAWGFPDAMQTVMSGECFDAMHGWYAQKALDNDQEMEEAIFSYKVRQRKLPHHTFQALALGKSKILLRVDNWFADCSQSMKSKGSRRRWCAGLPPPTGTGPQQVRCRNG